MVCKAFFKKYENLAGTAALLLVLLIFTAVRYDYYFDLNDDVLMKDILAGVYTGVPESRNIQMLWPVSALISLLYRALRQLPWYGIFLCLCHYGSIGLIVHRSLFFCRKLSGKILLLLGEGALIMGLLLPHLVSVQYTVTSALLAAAAAFLFLTTDAVMTGGASGRGNKAGEFIRKNIITVLLVFLAYLVRHWMLLLVLPLIGAAGMIRWGSEEKIFAKENLIKYLAVAGAIVAGLGIGQISQKIAYGSPEWKRFMELFNNRTELYDFQVLPEYEENRDFFEQAGLGRGEWELLDNYNFGLSQAIDEKLLGEVAAYAASNRSARQSFLEKLRESIGQYYRRTLYPPSHNESDFPWSYAVLLSYLAVFAAAMLGGEKKLSARFFQIVWKLAFLFLVRTVLWVWLIQRDRVPSRISHSMYLMELCILTALLFGQCALAGKNRRERRKAFFIPAAFGTLYGLFGAGILCLAITAADADTSQKAAANVRYGHLYSFLGSAENRGNFYFVDVYSSVAYTEKLFENVDNSLDNYDIMGGWACKSPLWRKKLAAFGITDAETALAEREDVFYVQETGADIGWLYRYYEDRGSEIEMELTEMVEDEFEIYRIRRK